MIRRIIEHPNGYICAVTAMYTSEGDRTDDLLSVAHFDFLDRLTTEHATITSGTPSCIIHTIQ